MARYVTNGLRACENSLVTKNNIAEVNHHHVVLFASLGGHGRLVHDVS